MIMTREEFEIYKETLVERFYWCRLREELKYLTEEKGNRYLFRCTHYKTKKYFWIFDKTASLMKNVAEYQEMKCQKNSESDAIEG